MNSVLNLFLYISFHDTNYSSKTGRRTKYTFTIVWNCLHQGLQMPGTLGNLW